MPIAPSSQLIVFDKDGVLLDLDQTWMPMIIGIADYLAGQSGGSASREQLLEAVGVEVAPGSDTGRILENSVFAAGTFAAMREIWEELCPALAPVFADAEGYRAEVKRIREAKVSGRTVAKGDVRAVLDQLRRLGHPLAVATNDSINSTKVNLEDMQISDCFDVIICADSGFGRKPEGGGLLEACRATGCSPEAAIMVGDTATDWLAAEAARFGHFVAIADSAPDLPGFIPSADAVLPSIETLAQAIPGFSD